MDMVVLAIEIYQFGLKVVADTGKDAPQIVDVVGAINVRRAGHARLACEVNGDRSRQQQEPPKEPRKRNS
jgi:hypothetical protein